MVPDIWEETIPELGAVEGEERPRTIWLGNLAFKVYAMTEDEASAIRDVVYSASVQYDGDSTVFMIVGEEIDALFNGTRSARDVARIIQNRVQTYLNERD